MAGRGHAHLGDPAEALLRVEDLHVRFRTGRGTVYAVTDVSLDIRRGETLGLVGESGCGKSTTGRAVMQLPPPTEGRVLYEGEDLAQLSGEDLRRSRTKLQMIFQDPISSLNPRRKVEDIVAEGLKIWQPTGWTTLAIAALVFTVVGALVTLSMFLGGGISTIGFFGVVALLIGIALGLMHFAGFGQAEDPGMAHLVDEILDAVGLDPTTARGRRPHQFSGGQCQRISIARAVVTEPDLIICDEPVSALDVSVQAQILNLLEDLKARYGLTLVFIAHDLAVVKNVSDRLAVMYLGRLCEVGTPDVIYSNPAHPYTKLLLEAIPEPDPDHRDKERAPLQGELPSPLAPPSGCHFRTRCPRAEEDCAELVPEMAPTGDGRFVACHHPLVETVVDIGSATRQA
ncbi:ATP-binding cassette domain-containing protein [Iamia sp. SCSIO 61187]|uniref:oligopeptide/dipeptide ABC transporter ATP-binding protein n=1 Tax=Iamia sp. SCSIO 61187 TaxID=2722752 RepID=UPI001C629819|nr:oligopeptide/dipeptide ABC transporter ATP-binding protein [Iamia sp. SCSIO 61187]QYG92992.1 ATP-binding cassette domain-containing protein [Iamia sp. SCSIO 61187]